MHGQPTKSEPDFVTIAVNVPYLGTTRTLILTQSSG